MITSKPFLKWAGNKHALIPVLTEHFGKGKRLVEPFLGSGAVFMGTDYKEYFLSDINPDLIGLYNNLKHNSCDVIAETKKLFADNYNTESAYYALRDEFNNLQDSTAIRKSAIFVYLNKHAFNGLCRYNSSGKFNVPYGRKNARKNKLDERLFEDSGDDFTISSASFPLEEMEKFAIKCEIAEFRLASFEETMLMAVEGDVVYCDPPYVPLTLTANFNSYSVDNFTMDNQRRLADLATELTNKNIRVIISNHDTDVSRELYKGATITEIDVRRYIASKSSQRGMAKELIAVFNKENK